jgi:probable addiction module antidote protein
MNKEELVKRKAAAMDKKLAEYDTLSYLKNDIELQKEYISELLKEYINDNNADAFLSALKPLIELNGSISAFAKKTGINRTYFYKLFKKEVTPEFPTIVVIIKNLGFDINLSLNKL